MTTKIPDDATRALYIYQIAQIDEKLTAQYCLPYDARITGFVREKLKAMRDSLEHEVMKYDLLNEF